MAATEKGHLTDVAVKSSLKPFTPVELFWQPEVILDFHSNDLKFEALDKNSNVYYDKWTIFSVGGGVLANKEMKT